MTPGIMAASQQPNGNGGRFPFICPRLSHSPFSPLPADMNSRKRPHDEGGTGGESNLQYLYCYIHIVHT